MKAHRSERSAFALTVCLGLALLAPGTGQASKRGLLFIGESLTQNALAEQIPFSNGELVDLRRLITSNPAEPYEDGDLLVHDLETGITRRAGEEVVDTAIVSPVETTASTLSELFATLGTVVLFESPGGGPLDPTNAERYDVHRPHEGTAVYLPPGFQIVPEPALASCLACGAALLSGLGKRRRRL